MIMKKENYDAFMEEQKKMMQERIEKTLCPLCKGKGYYQEAKGEPVHTCFKCLREGKLQ